MTKNLSEKLNKHKARRSHRESENGPAINSWSALTEYLRAKPEAIRRIACAPSEEKKLKALIERLGLAVECRTDSSMSEGFSASISVNFLEEEEMFAQALSRHKDIIVACDHVTDTRNLGAIARSAAYFGCQTLLLPRDRQAPINSSCLGAAQGAFAWIEPVAVVNLGRALERLKECGYWIVAADMDGKPLAEVKTPFDKMVLILGSEDKGIGANILSKSDVKISIASPSANLESLNVSVAAGILIHALRQRLAGN